MSALLTTDYLAAEALTICQAAGLLPAETEIEATITLRRDKSQRFDLTVWDTNASRNQLDCHTALVMEPSAERALGKLAEKLGVEWPIQFATAEQRDSLIRLYNTAHVTAAEKTKMLLGLNTYTCQQAEAMLSNGPDSFRQELVRRQLAERGFAFVGSAELVAA